MKLRVLGCSGGIGARARTTSFLVDEDILIDAGTGVEDLSVDDIAQQLGCSTGTVKTHLSRARANLAEALEMEEDR